MKDILIFMSDQHTALYTGFQGGGVDTPNLDRLAAEGTVFTDAYTVCPLCTPARAAMLSAIRPARTGLFGLCDALPDTMPTFLHYLVECGYETVLIGRMHFIGLDQHHGFTKRLGKDMTSVAWSPMAERGKGGRGVFRGFNGHRAPYMVGGGSYSPVLEYDEAVVQTALEYLSQPHEKPQCICVSLYGPHFPYVAPRQLYEKYLDTVHLPVSFRDPVDSPVLAHYRHPELPEQTARACLAAYCGMIETVDHHFGRVREAFEHFVAARGSERLICYLSDHGDTCGDRSIYGKETFYERSVRIPMLFAGDGVLPEQRIRQPVSILDFGPTLVAYAGGREMLQVDGVSLLPALRGGDVPEHPVFSEFMERTDGKSFYFDRENATFSYGFMLRNGDYKYFVYDGYEENEALFCLDTDPEERNNLAESEPARLLVMRRKAAALYSREEIYRNFWFRERDAALMVSYEQATGRIASEFQWRTSNPAALRYPEAAVLTPDMHNPA